MERITLTRTATSEAAPASLRIIIRVKTRPLRVAFLLVALLLWGYGAAGLVLPILRPSEERVAPEGERPIVEDVGLLVFAGVGFTLIARLAWILIGRETFEISPLA